MTRTEMSRTGLTRAALVETTLTFGTSVADDIEALRYLREATSHAVRLAWTLAGVPLVDLDTHIHLVRPSGGVDTASRAYADRWAAGYRYGSYFYRQGPGFVMVKDVRPGREPNRMVIEDGSEHLLEMAAARDVSDLSPGARAALDEAEAAGLVLRDGDTLLVLPYRMRHWPVPYIAA